MFCTPNLQKGGRILAIKIQELVVEGRRQKHFLLPSTIQSEIDQESHSRDQNSRG